MRIPLLATLSGRIVLGFAILILTFGTISAVIVVNMGLLSREIRLIRTAYLPLALETKNLDEKQDMLWSYISNELPLETDASRARRQLLQHEQARVRSLRDTEKVLGGLTALPEGHSRQLDRTQRLVAKLREDIESQAPRYKVLMQTPPLARPTDAPPMPPEREQTYRDALETRDLLVADESGIRTDIRRLAKQQSDQAKYIARSLERNERRVRIFSIYLGLGAVLVGLLIVIWATLTLRPLRRLRDAARRIASGDYQSRIDEKGPTEVADLAREFNVMGQAVEEREQARVRHERLAAVGKMAAMIVHEVRNPLSAIGLNTELLEEELTLLGDSEEARELCRAITTEVDRLTAITEQYLQVARLPKPQLQPEQLNNLVRSIAEFQREDMALRGVALTLELAEELPLVQIDETQMRQAVLNLLRNSTDATVEVGGGRVTLRSRVRHGAPDGDRSADRSTDRSGGDARTWVELCVSDEGPGIADDLASKLFEPFFSTKDGGTGLGLALTHQIIREHGGDIRLSSAPGSGATFIVSLPAL